jgi:hypothetical protein
MKWLLYIISVLICLVLFMNNNFEDSVIIGLSLLCAMQSIKFADYKLQKN